MDASADREDAGPASPATRFDYPVESLNGPRAVPFLFAPLARAPGRRGFWSRFAPEICALLVYALFFGVALFLAWRRSSTGIDVTGDMDTFHPPFEVKDVDWSQGSVWGYGLAGLIMLLMPMIWAAWSLADERARGTAEALVLVPGSRRALVWGRYLRAALPWIRFALLLIPIYLVLSCNRWLTVNWRSGGRAPLLSVALYAVGCKPLLLLPLSLDGFGAIELSTAGVLATGLRFARDLLGIMLVSALAFYISARARSRFAATLIACLVVPASAITIFSSPVWVIVAMRIASNFMTEKFSPGEVVVGYMTAHSLTILLEIGLVALLPSRVARHFDAYMTGE